MMTVFDKNQSRWVMKRAHDLAKRHFKEGTYSERFAKALKMAHAEAAKVVAINNKLLNRFACHWRCRSFGNALHDRLMAIDVFAYNGLKPLSILGCFETVYSRHEYESDKVCREFCAEYLASLDARINDVLKMRDFYYEPNRGWERDVFPAYYTFF